MKEKYLMGEVCKLFNTTRDTLVHYENIGLIHPKKDGNGYRYFNLEDLNSLTDVFFLKKLNLPLSDINKAIHNSTPSDILDILIEKEKHLEAELKRINELQQTLKAMKLNVQSCINQLNRLEIKDEKETFLFIEITKEKKFNDFVDIMEGMTELAQGAPIVNKNFLEYVNFSFLIEEGALFSEIVEEKIKWGVTLKHSNAIGYDLSVHPKVERIQEQKYWYTVIAIDDSDYTGWIKKIRNIVMQQDLCINGAILGRMLLTEYNNGEAIDYYELFFPII